MELIKFGNKLCGAVESRIGGREENQDSYVFSETRFGLFVAVCDGMGGGPAGKTASVTACAVIDRVVKQARPGLTARQILRQAIDMAHAKLYSMAENSPELRGMGTTCVCIIISKTRRLTVAHIGDSRCIVIRDGKIVWRTADHSYVGELVRSGKISPDEARKSSYSNVITRALGIKKVVEPDISSFMIRPGDRIALMSDGIWGMVPEDMMIHRLASNDTPAYIVGNIEDNIDTLGRDNGGVHDNMTLALIDVHEPNYLKVSPQGRIHAQIQPSPIQAAPTPTPSDSVRNDDLKSDPLDSNSSKDRRKRSGKGILWTIIILLLLACLGSWSYFYFKSSEKSGGTKKEVKELINPKEVTEDDLKKSEEAILNSKSRDELLGDATDKLNELKTYDPDKYSKNKREERLRVRKELRKKTAEYLEYAARKTKQQDKKTQIKELQDRILKDNTICNGIDGKFGRSTKDAENAIGAYVSQINSFISKE